MVLQTIPCVRHDSIIKTKHKKRVSFAYLQIRSPEQRNDDCVEISPIVNEPLWPHKWIQLKTVSRCHDSCVTISLESLILFSDYDEPLKDRQFLYVNLLLILIMGWKKRLLIPTASPLQSSCLFIFQTDQFHFLYSDFTACILIMMNH